MYFTSGVTIKHPESNDIIIAEGDTVTVSELEMLCNEHGIDEVNGMIHFMDHDKRYVERYL